MRAFELAAPEGEAIAAGSRLLVDIVFAELGIGDGPAPAHHAGIDIDTILIADRDMAPAIHVAHLAGQRPAFDQAFQRPARGAPAGPFPARQLAGLARFHGVDAEKPDAVLAHSDRVAIGHGDLADQQILCRGIGIIVRQEGAGERGEPEHKSEHEDGHKNAFHGLSDTPNPLTTGFRGD